MEIRVVLIVASLLLLAILLILVVGFLVGLYFFIRLSHEINRLDGMFNDFFRYYIHRIKPPAQTWSDLAYPNTNTSFNNHQVSTFVAPSSLDQTETLNERNRMISKQQLFNKSESDVIEMVASLQQKNESTQRAAVSCINLNGIE